MHLRVPLSVLIIPSLSAHFAASLIPASLIPGLRISLPPALMEGCCAVVFPQLSHCRYSGGTGA